VVCVYVCVHVCAWVEWGVEGYFKCAHLNIVCCACACVCTCADAHTAICFDLRFARSKTV
jgi:hypothetical protein